MQRARGSARERRLEGALHCILRKRRNPSPASVWDRILNLVRVLLNAHAIRLNELSPSAYPAKRPCCRAQEQIARMRSAHGAEHVPTEHPPGYQSASLPRVQVCAHMAAHAWASRRAHKVAATRRACARSSGRLCARRACLEHRHAWPRAQTAILTEDEGHVGPSKRRQPSRRPDAGDARSCRIDVSHTYSGAA